MGFNMHWDINHLPPCHGQYRLKQMFNYNMFQLKQKQQQKNNFNMKHTVLD